MRVALRVARPEHEQRHHHDAASHAEQPRQEAAAEPDREQLRVERERLQAVTHGAAD